MKLRVENFRGARTIQVDVAHISLFAGPNGAGKSSICEAVARLLTGEVTPPGLPKNRAIALVHAGKESGRVTLWDKDFEAELSWPSCKLTTAGERPACSVVAAGLIRPAQYLGVEGRDLWAKLLKVDVTAADFATAVQRMDIKIGAGTLEAVMKEITEKGAQQAAIDIGNRVKELRGVWEKTSGAGRWGHKKAEEYRPVGLRSEMDLVQAKQDLADKEKKRSQLVVDDTVLRQERERKIVLAGAKAEANKAAEDASEHLGAAERAVIALPSINDRTPIPCPHCGGPLDVFATHQGAQINIKKMEAKDNIPAVKLKEMRLERQAAEQALEHAKVGVRQANRQVEEIAAAEAWLKANPEKVSTGAMQDRRLLDDEIATLVRDIKNYEDWQAAHDVHRRIMLADQCQQLVDPKGPIASEKMQALIGHINTMAENVSTTAKYGKVELERSDEGVVSVTLNGRAYPLLSAGERCKVDFVLQMTLASVDGSKVVVVDDLEALDDKGWEGVIGALHVSPFTSFVAYTQHSRKRMPPLAEHDMGAAYWILNGEVAA